MTKKFCLIVLLLPIKAQAYIDLSHLGQEQYQDIVIDNKIVSSGKRMCATRYETIKERVLSKYTRPFTMIDLGASQGYFSFRTAYDFPHASCVMVEGDYNDAWKVAQQLLELCELNNKLDNIVCLNKRIVAQDLERLADCEHFDVVLALNIIHHCNDWKRVADAILRLGDNVIIETPPATDSIAKGNDHIGQLEAYLIQQGGELILETPRHTNPKVKGKMLWFKKKKERLCRRYWLAGKAEPFFPNYLIVSDFTKKLFIKNSVDEKENRPWVPGINLVTYLMLNGVYPARDFFRKQLQAFENNQEDDFSLWNIIINGKNIQLIDRNNSLYNLDPKKCYDFAMHLFDLPAQERQVFFNNNWEMRATWKKS